MSNVDIKSMFDSIKGSLSNVKQGSSSFKNILKTEVGNTYIVRLIPNVKDPKATFYHYFHHGWTSMSTGQYVDTICPRTFDERCPVCEARFKLYKTKTEEDKKLAYNIRQMEKHLVNVYVVSDPTTPANEGTIKILRFGKRIYDKILAATEGDDAAEFGPKVYDLTENGCSFKIKVESTSEGKKSFTNYNNSRFMAPSAIVGITPEKIKEIYSNIFDLSKQVEVQSIDAINEALNTHFYGAQVAKTAPVKSEATKKVEKDDDLDMGKDSAEPAVDKVVAPVVEKEAAPKKTDNDKIKNLLADLDSL